MLSQSGKLTALYYRAAHRNTDTLHLDNQMQQLLCYAKQQELGGYLLYVDNGFSGVTFDRPALSALKADIAAGRIKEIIITGLSRLGRGYYDTMRFMDWVKSNGVEIRSLTDDICAIPDVPLAFMKGGARK